MDDIVLFSELRSRGYDSGEVDRLARSGVLTRVRRGAYASADDMERSVADQHRRLIAATVPQLKRDGVVSHSSAAVLHGLPVGPAIWSEST